MSNNYPIFPMPEFQDFTNYGFQSQTNNFQLQKPERNKTQWWKNSFLVSKRKSTAQNHKNDDDNADFKKNRARVFRGLSGPVYIIDSRRGSTSRYRITHRPSCTPVAGKWTPIGKGEMEIPYFSLREVNMEEQRQKQRISRYAMPLYFVT